MTEVRKLVGDRLKQAREKKNLKQNRVAKDLGIHNSTLAKYESGKREADYETLDKLAKLYEVSHDWLAGGEINKNEIVSQIVDRAGEPGSKERRDFADKFIDEFQQIPEDTQKALFELIRTINK